MKFTDTKIIGFVLILAFGGSSCQTLNCGCPMAEVEESDGEMLRLGEREMGRLGESVRGRFWEGVTGRLGEGEILRLGEGESDRETSRLDEGVNREFEIVD